MKNITIQGIDETLDHALKTAANQASRSINQLVLEVLHERFGLAKTVRHTCRHHDLDDLFGRWSEEEYQRIEAMVSEQRMIDPEIWK